MAKITDYPSITTIDANTILLADGSSGTGKILASDMAKYALETYAGSTLAGSAQSVKTLSNKPTITAIQKNEVSLNTLTVPGRYACNRCTDTPENTTSWVSLTVLPNGSGGDGAAGYVIQIAVLLHSSDLYVRHCSNGTFSAWEKLPTRAEVDALNNKTRLTMTRTENNLVDVTSFNRVAAYKCGNMLWLNGNLVVSEGPASSPVEIGRIAGWSAVISAYQNVPFQGNGAKVIIVEVTSGGVINISSITGIASGFYRFSFCVPCA